MINITVTKSFFDKFEVILHCIYIKIANKKWLNLILQSTKTSTKVPIQ